MISKVFNIKSILIKSKIRSTNFEFSDKLVWFCNDFDVEWHFIRVVINVRGLHFVDFKNYFNTIQFQRFDIGLICCSNCKLFLVFLKLFIFLK